MQKFSQKFRALITRLIRRGMKRERLRRVTIEIIILFLYIFSPLHYRIEWETNNTYSIFFSPLSFRRVLYIYSMGIAVVINLLSILLYRWMQGSTREENLSAVVFSRDIFFSYSSQKYELV